MKKIYQSVRWKAYSRRRARRELEKRRRGKVKKASKNRGHRRAKSRWQSRPVVTLVAPEVFSLIRNPDQTARFFGRLGRLFQTRRNAYIELSGVIELTSDAVVVLLSKLIDQRFVNGMSFGGNEPRAEGPRNLLIQAGFFEFVKSAQLKPPPEDGKIRRRTDLTVEPLESSELVRFAMKKLTGEESDHRPSQRALVECMANTHEHSEKSEEGKNPWWANVYCPADTGRSFFTVVDNGVGIFSSMTVRRFRRFAQSIVGQSGNAELLRDWLEGRIEVPSRTGLRNRGKGMLAIYRRFTEGHLKNLIIVSNDVYADLRNNRYVTLGTPFKGTMVYWELWK